MGETNPTKTRVNSGASELYIKQSQLPSTYVCYQFVESRKRKE